MKERVTITTPEVIFQNTAGVSSSKLLDNINNNFVFKYPGKEESWKKYHQLLEVLAGRPEKTTKELANILGISEAEFRRKLHQLANSAKHQLNPHTKIISQKYRRRSPVP